MIQTNRFLKEFSTFAIGGPIRFFLEVRTIQEMKKGFLFASKEKLPVLILGKGSNSLFDDRGFNGLVILNKIDFCHWDEGTVHAGAGFSFSLLGVHSAKRGFSGLEFASGIPASVGGAVFMNAGANGNETCDHLEKVEFLHLDGREETFFKHDMEFQYRTSIFHQLKGAILSATFCLPQGGSAAREKQLKIIDYRKKTQPLKAWSVGCIFRNPSKEMSAGRLIEKAGLKNVCQGGAQVSEIHSNFIINIENATCKDVEGLIAKIQTTVLEKTGVHLEPEVRKIAYE
jgi:UDP-N-acetylmuramate dehydrogenase